MKIKVLHVMQSLEPGGLENGVVNIINFIDNRRFCVHVYCIKKLGRFCDRIRNSQTEVYLCPNRNMLTNIIWDIRCFCKNNNIDIVHTHGWGTLLVGSLGALMARVPVINGEHGVLYDETIKRRLAQYFLFNMVDKNLSVSSELVTDIANRFSVKKALFETIHNGIDQEKFYVDRESALQVRRQLGITIEKFIVGTVGRLNPIKHYNVLISAFAQFCKASPDVDATLVITGDGAERQRLQELSNKLGISGNTLFLGHRDDIPALLNAMDLFVLTSESEGLSNTIMEAMACGTPVVATDVGGNRELVNNGETGILFSVDDIHGLAKVLASLYRDKSKIDFFAANSVARIKKEFSIEVMVKKYEDFYISLLRQKGRI